MQKRKEKQHSIDERGVGFFFLVLLPERELYQPISQTSKDFDTAHCGLIGNVSVSMKTRAVLRGRGENR